MTLKKTLEIHFHTSYELSVSAIDRDVVILDVSTKLQYDLHKVIQSPSVI